MMRELLPVLAQFTASSPPGNLDTDLELDRATGLLHRQGCGIPFIEELLAAPDLWSRSIWMTTFLSRAADDRDDDLVRGNINARSSNWK
jgi:hypothetical protein